MSVHCQLVCRLACRDDEVEWVLNDDGDDYERVSKRTGTVIPMPSRAYATYEYTDAAKYIGKGNI